MYARGVSIVKLKYNQREIILNEVLYVPELRGNFLSVSKTTARNYSVKFIDDTAKIMNQSGNIIMTANKRNDLFVVGFQKKTVAFQQSNCESNLFTKWHHRYGQFNLASLKQTRDKNMVFGLMFKSVPEKLDCATCMKAKIHVNKFLKQKSRSIKISS